MSFGKAARLTNHLEEVEEKRKRKSEKGKRSRQTIATAEHLYRNLCQESKAVYRHDVVKMLRKGVIQVIIARGSFDESLTVLAKLLREAPKDISIVDIRQEDRTPLLPSPKTTSPIKGKNMQNKKKKRPSSSSKRGGDSIETLVSKLIRGLSQMLRSAESEIQSVRLSGISMTGSNMKRLASGVSKSTSLKHLIVERSDVNDLDFGVLCRALKDQTSLLILSVNRCNLTDTAAHDAQRLVKNQCLRRDHEQWLTGLRDGEVVRVALRGLQVLDLHGHDGITDRAGTILAKTLTYDHWISEINLCETNIGTQGVESIIQVLETRNDTLRGLQIESTRVDDAVSLRLQTLLGEREPADSFIYDALSVRFWFHSFSSNNILSRVTTSSHNAHTHTHSYFPETCLQNIRPSRCGKKQRRRRER